MAVVVAAGPHAAAQALFSGGSAVRGNAAAGQATYSRSCLACHGPRLEGSPFGPTLVGRTFQDRWRGKPAAELLAQMRSTMPPRGTGTVKPEVFPDLLAFLVKANVEGAAFLAKLPAPATPAAPAATAHAAPLPAAVAQRLARLPAVTDALLASPPEGDWLMWRRTFDAAGFSPLRQIDRRSVQRLRRAWSLPLDPSGNEITPLVHDGVLFVHSGASLVAVDAASGALLWKYRREIARPAGGRQFDPARRARVKSIALYGHAVFMPTPDGHLVALDARSGRVLWDRAINSGAANSGLQLSSGPLVARGVVMIGASLGLANKGGCFIVALDAATGAEKWRFQTVARPGTPGGDSWNGAPVDERFGAGVWTTGSYDPALGLAYFGVGNTYTTATLLQPRPGAGGVGANDALFTDATLALRPESGELVWYHQHHRRDVWDQDWAFEQTLVTLGNGAAARRAVVTGGKTAVFEAVDAATGEFLFAHDTGLSNLYAAIDPATGAKRTNPALEPVPGKPLLLCPGNLGARNWPATSFNPATGMLFVPLLESCAQFTWEPRAPGETAQGGSDIRFSPRMRPGSDGKLGRMIALDLNSRRVKWTHRQRMPLASSLLATAGGLVFMGDVDRNFGAYDQDSGTLLWSTRLPASVEATPVSYAVNGRQYIALVSGEGSHLGSYNRGLVPELGDPVTDISLLVFALPEG
ncbi:MAG TPA: PQQ-binding-like beta-propeller repeat protein [Steroidobacteraceae bacterium]|nr:PQQ-binding-like beta-propeller repeat protein [Steroidobacteraceae bacterium]